MPSRDLLAHTYDINLAVDARAATQIEHQAVRWVSEFVGFPATIGAFTSGGTISNVTALAAAREQALPGARTEGLSGAGCTVYCSAEVHYSITRAVELLGRPEQPRATCRSTTPVASGRTRWPKRSIATSPPASCRSPSWPPPAPR